MALRKAWRRVRCAAWAAVVGRWRLLMAADLSSKLPALRATVTPLRAVGVCPSRGRPDEAARHRSIADRRRRAPRAASPSAPSRWCCAQASTRPRRSTIWTCRSTRRSARTTGFDTVMEVSAMPNWFDAFFAGAWLDVQRSFWPAESSEKQATLLERVLTLRRGLARHRRPVWQRPVDDRARAPRSPDDRRRLHAGVPRRGARGGGRAADHFHRTRHAPAGRPGRDSTPPSTTGGRSATSTTPVTRRSRRACARRWCPAAASRSTST